MRVRACASLVLLVVLATPAGASSRGGLDYVATWPEAGNGAVIPDPVGSRILSIANTSTGMRISVFDGDRTQLARRNLDPYVVGVGPGDPIVYAFDAPGRRLTLLVYPSASDRQLAVNPRLVTVDMASKELRTASDRPLSVFPPGYRYLGMSRSADGRLQIVGQLSVLGLRAFGVLVAEIDPDVAGPTITPSTGPVPVRGCQNVISTSDQAAMLRAGKRLYLGCATTNMFGNSLPGTAAVAGIDLSDPVQPDLHFLPGTYGQAESYVDPQAGDQGRLLLVGSSAGKPGQAVWVFDIAHRAMVGQIAAGEIYGGGVDPGTGRLYVSVKGAMQVSIDRGREIPQAVSYENVKPLPAPIRVIPFNRTVIVLVQGADKQPVWTVYRDTTPPDLFVPAEAPDPTVHDRKVSETVQFEGDAQAFGFRVKDMGGVTAAMTNATGQPLAWWGAIGSFSGLRDGDRDLHFGAILAAHLGADEASANAITINQDQNTADDHVTLTREGWPFRPALCADFSGSPKTATGTNAAWAPGPPPQAVCDQAGGRVEVDAQHNAADASGLVTVGASSASAQLVREASGGLSVVTTAEARDVVIADTVRIGEISSEARAHAFGGAHEPPLPGKASATYRRRFEHVSTPDFSCSTVCPPNEVLVALSAALGSQFEIELPAPEVVATPRGAHAHAWREPWGHQQDVVLINQPLTQTQVPALRVSYVGDNVLPSRLIFEFAAAKGDATWTYTGPVPVVIGGADAGPAPAASVRSGRERAAGVFTASSDDPVASASTGAPAANPVVRVVRFAARGWRWVFAGSIGDFARSASVWFTLGAPLFLAARRRYLLRTTRPA